MMEKKEKIRDTLVEAIPKKAFIEKLIISEGSPMIKSFLFILVIIVPVLIAEIFQGMGHFDKQFIIPAILGILWLFASLSYLFYAVEKYLQKIEDYYEKKISEVKQKEVEIYQNALREKEKIIDELMKEKEKTENEVIKLESFKDYVYKQLENFHEYDKRNAIFNNYTVCKNTLQEILNYYIKLWGRK